MNVPRRVSHPWPAFFAGALVVLMLALQSVAWAQVPVLYYDFENNTTRTTFENAVELAMNTGSGALVKTGGGTIGGVSGAGTQNGGAANGQALTCTNWDASTTDPGTSASAYHSFVVNMSGLSGLVLTFAMTWRLAARGRPRPPSASCVRVQHERHESFTARSPGPPSTNIALPLLPEPRSRASTVSGARPRSSDNSRDQRHHPHLRLRR
ncbi:MAG: hypothetical protein U0704_01150 [Candidatus Eisenbacteria bacterium]